MKFHPIPGHERLVVDNVLIIFFLNKAFFVSNGLRSDFVFSFAPSDVRDPAIICAGYDALI